MMLIQDAVILKAQAATSWPLSLTVVLYQPGHCKWGIWCYTFAVSDGTWFKHFHRRRSRCGQVVNVASNGCLKVPKMWKKRLMVKKKKQQRKSMVDDDDDVELFKVGSIAGWLDVPGNCTPHHHAYQLFMSRKNFAVAVLGSFASTSKNWSTKLFLSSHWQLANCVKKLCSISASRGELPFVCGSMSMI